MQWMTWFLHIDDTHFFWPNSSLPSSRFSSLWISNDGVSPVFIYSTNPRASAVNVCVESAADTPGMPIFGIRGLWQRGRHSILVQHLGGKRMLVSVCVLLSKRMRRDPCKCRLPDGALFALLLLMTSTENKARLLPGKAHGSTV